MDQKPNKGHYFIVYKYKEEYPAQRYEPSFLTYVDIEDVYFTPVCRFETFDEARAYGESASIGGFGTLWWIVNLDPFRAVNDGVEYKPFVVEATEASVFYGIDYTTEPAPTISMGTDLKTALLDCDRIIRKEDE